MIKLANLTPMQKNKAVPKISRWMEIVKVRAEINKIETKKTMQKTSENKG